MSALLRPVLLAFAAVAAIGLILSVASHLAALLGMAGPLGDHAPVLHVGIFVVWLPTVLVANAMGGGRRPGWSEVLRGCPPWMKYIVSVSASYAVVNFILFLLSAPPKTAANGMPPSVVRGFSGHWMVFYSAAMAVLYSGAQTRERERRCRNGHLVSSEARFCEECGQAVDEESATAFDSLKLR